MRRLILDQREGAFGKELCVQSENKPDQSSEVCIYQPNGTVIRPQALALDQVTNMHFTSRLNKTIRQIQDHPNPDCIIAKALLSGASDICGFGIGGCI